MTIATLDPYSNTGLDFGNKVNEIIGAVSDRRTDRVLSAHAGSIGVNATGITIASVNVGGTNVAGTLATTSKLAATKRVINTSVSTTGAIVGQQPSQGGEVFVSNVAGQGGFYLSSIFAAPILPSTSQLFVGLRSSIATISGANNYSSTGYTEARVGLVLSNAGPNFSILTCNGTTASLTSPSPSIAYNSTDLYRLEMWQAAGGSATINYIITNISSGASSVGIANTTMPPSGTALSYIILAGNLTGTGACELNFVNMFLKSSLV